MSQGFKTIGVSPLFFFRKLHQHKSQTASNMHTPSLFFVVILFAILGRAAPTEQMVSDLTGTPFTSSCGLSGTVTSGSMHWTFQGDCRETETEFSCLTRSHFNFRNVKVTLDDGQQVIVTDSSTLRNSFTFSPDRFSSSTSVNLNARLVGRGTGPIESYKTLIRCSTENDIRVCRVERMEQNC